MFKNVGIRTSILIYTVFVSQMQMSVARADEYDWNPNGRTDAVYNDGIIGGGAVNSSYQDEMLWPNGTPFRQYNGLDLAPLRYGNRAECAVESENPTYSSFLIIDGYNAGKATNSLAQATGQDKEALVNKGLQSFRIASTYVMMQVMESVLKGELPLLPLEYDSKALKSYAQISKSCEGKTACAERDAYISKLWKLKGSEDIKEWQKLDGFNANSFISFNQPVRLGCYYIKQYSQLQGHLKQTKPTLESLQQLGQDAVSSKSFVTSCFDTDPKLESRYANLQIDILGLDDKLWKTIGFDYWNTIKIYFSWAWRNSDWLQATIPELAPLFKSLAIEESLMLVPNGCRSIDKPSCDADYLSLNSIRQLAAGVATDHSKEVPAGPGHDMIVNPNTAINDDILGVSDISASDWVKKFRTQYSLHRGMMKNRFVVSTQLLDLITANVTINELTESIQQIALSAQKSGRMDARNQLYYMCAEFDMAHNAQFSFMKKDLETLKSVKFLDGYNSLTESTIEQLFDSYSRLADNISDICHKLVTDKIWENDFKLDPVGFNRWYKETVSASDIDVEAAPYTALVPQPLLVMTNEADASQDIICADGIECSRRILKGIVDIYAASVYANGFLPLQDKVSSPALFNPYAERKACKVYDPFFQRKAAFKAFAVDLANTALFGWNPVPLYFSIELRPGQVVNFNKLVQDGKVKFDPVMIKDKTSLTLLADLGPLTGVPCTVAVGASASNPFDYLALTGISISACRSNTTNVINVSGPGSINNSGPKTSSFCGACHLNLTAASALAPVTSGFNPVKLFAYLFKSFVRLAKNLNDPINIPRNATVDVNSTAKAYLRFGTIPKKCVASLSKGLECFEDRCAQEIGQYIEKTFGAPATNISTRVTSKSVSANVETLGCHGFYRVDAQLLGGKSCDVPGAIKVVRAKGIGDCSNKPIGAVK